MWPPCAVVRILPMDKFVLLFSTIGHTATFLVGQAINHAHNHGFIIGLLEVQTSAPVIFGDFLGIQGLDLNHGSEPALRGPACNLLSKR